MAVKATSNVDTLKEKLADVAIKIIEDVQEFNKATFVNANDKHLELLATAKTIYEAVKE